MQELQEATQSHQVRKAEFAISNLFESTNMRQKPESKDQQSKRKMCVLLIEDINIVFEQDDGFIFSLTQLINTSKRPVILTTTDYNSSYVQKFLNEHEYISFSPLSSSLLATWLQILCLVEGIFVDKADIGSLLNSNNGDIRKTILQLQFWVQSGGQLIQNDMPIKIEHVSEETEEKFIDDEDTDLLKGEGKGKSKYFTHKDCIRSFKIFENEQYFFIPYYLDLGLLWWNIPNILHWPNFFNERMHKSNQEDIVPYQTQNKKAPLTTKKMNYKLVTKLYESFLFAEVMFTKLNYFDNAEPTIRNNISDVTDSLELNQRSDDFPDNLEFTHEITHSLVDGYIKEYSKKENIDVKFNVGLPGKLEKR